MFRCCCYTRYQIPRTQIFAIPTIRWYNLNDFPYHWRDITPTYSSSPRYLCATHFPLTSLPHYFYTPTPVLKGGEETRDLLSLRFKLIDVFSVDEFILVYLRARPGGIQLNPRDQIKLDKDEFPQTQTFALYHTMSPSLLYNDTFDEEVPILIIGGGPSGLLLAFMLEKFGGPYTSSKLEESNIPQICILTEFETLVRSLIAERYATRLAAPKAHALSPRSLEMCRQFGLDVNEIRMVGTPRRDAYWVNFITSLAGESVGKLPYERMDAEVLNSTPTVSFRHSRIGDFQLLNWHTDDSQYSAACF